MSGGTNVGRVIEHADGVFEKGDDSDNHVTNGGSVVEYEDGVAENVDVSENDFSKGVYSIEYVVSPFVIRE